MLEKEKYENRKWWIDQHRKMWSSLARKVQMTRITNIDAIKKDYLSSIYGYNIPIYGCCYCCEYAQYVNEVLICHGWEAEHNCGWCPIAWKNGCCFGGEYDELFFTDNYSYIASMCRTIANLPETPEPKFLIQSGEILTMNDIVKLHNRGKEFEITHKVLGEG